MSGKGSGATVNRRGLLQGLVATATMACSSDLVVPDATLGMGGGGGAGEGPSSVSTATTSTGGGGGQGGEGGAAPGCDDSLGLSPEELFAPIEHIVVLCLENRSFDHYLGGSLGLVEGHQGVNGLSGSESNDHPDRGAVLVHQMAELAPDDPPHTWDQVHTQWNHGAMDGFVKAAVESGVNPEYDEVMGYYVRDQIPIHHALVDAYVLCNAYHSSVLGPTWPNRFYLHGATSNGLMANTPFVGFQSVWPLLKDAGATAKNYHGDVPWALGGYLKGDDLSPFANFELDAMAGTLPNYALIDPRFFGALANDDHPSNANVPLAQALISEVYTTLAQSPSWEKCLLVVTYDEHGGFFDHVSPPASNDEREAFDHLGVRVAALMAGPYVRQGCAVNTVVDHVAILKSLGTRWGIPSLTARMEASADLSSFLDPVRVKNRSPSLPISLPQLTVRRSRIRAHAERLARGLVPPQHPELVDALAQHGIYKAVQKKMMDERVAAHQLERAARRGIIRLL